MKRFFAWLKCLFTEPITSIELSTDEQIETEAIPQIWTARRVPFNGVEQWCLCGSDGNALFGFGENRSLASGRARMLNVGAKMRIDADRATTTNPIQAASQRRLQLVKGMQ